MGNTLQGLTMAGRSAQEIRSLATLHPEFLRGYRRSAKLPLRFFYAMCCLFAVSLPLTLFSGWNNAPEHWISLAVTSGIAAGTGAGIMWNLGRKLLRWAANRRNR